jgi:LysR family glycine cleavage system transcriptional activator
MSAFGDGRWPDLKSTFLLRDAFFPVRSPALLEGTRCAVRRT